MTLLESSGGSWDENGFHLWLRDDDGVETRLRITATETARELLTAVEPLREWVADHDRERAAYDRASPEERAAVLGHEPPESGYEPDDPKSPGYHDRMSDLADSGARHGWRCERVWIDEIAAWRDAAEGTSV